MKSDRTSAEVFVDAVRDELNGTPHASHPVQFVQVGVPYTVACTLCGSLVSIDQKWQDKHRKNHDDHSRVHGKIETEARRYKSPPVYG